MIKRVDAEVLMSPESARYFRDTVSELQAAQTTKRGSTFLGLSLTKKRAHDTAIFTKQIDTLKTFIQSSQEDNESRALAQSLMELSLTDYEVSEGRDGDSRHAIQVLNHYVSEENKEAAFKALVSRTSETDNTRQSMLSDLAISLSIQSTTTVPEVSNAAIQRIETAFLVNSIDDATASFMAATGLSSADQARDIVSQLSNLRGDIVSEALDRLMQDPVLDRLDDPRTLSRIYTVSDAVLRAMSSTDKGLAIQKVLDFKSSLKATVDDDFDRKTYLQQLQQIDLNTTRASVVTPGMNDTASPFAIFNKQMTDRLDQLSQLVGAVQSVPFKAYAEDYVEEIEAIQEEVAVYYAAAGYLHQQLEDEMPRFKDVLEGLTQIMEPPRQAFQEPAENEPMTNLYDNKAVQDAVFDMINHVSPIQRASVLLQSLYQDALYSQNYPSFLISVYVVNLMF